MQYTKKQIEEMDRITRLKIVNAVSGIKPANLIGTISNDKKTNLAIFGSVIHLGSSPALLGFIMRPTGDVPRHTYENIIQNGHYTINHIHRSFAKKAHYTSAKLDRESSEFEVCKLTEEYIPNFKAPFVKESTFKIGMQFKQEINIPLNGTTLIIGEIEHLILPHEIIKEDQDIDLSITNTVGISGLNTYYGLEKIAHFPYVRTNELPDFK